MWTAVVFAAAVRGSTTRSIEEKPCAELLALTAHMFSIF